MFSLIITILAIALVIALALATLYYGGPVFARSQVNSAAATLIAQAVQIGSAGAVADSQGAPWPTGGPTFAQPFLAAVPVPPKSAYTSDVPAATDWTYYVPGTHHFALKSKIRRDVCMAVNRTTGLIGIPAVWDGTSRIQCFGPGVATAPGGPKAYTFFYMPVGITPAQNGTALDESKTEAGSTTPGYPRLCPDDSSITSGFCPDTEGSGSQSGGSSDPGSGSGAGPTPPSIEIPAGDFTLVPYPGAVAANGETRFGNAQWFCSTDAAPDTFKTYNTLTVNGVRVTIDDAYTQSGTQCVGVFEGFGMPSFAAGEYVVTLKNSQNKTGTGSVRYVENMAPSPGFTGMTPSEATGETPTVVTITGSNFTADTRVYLDQNRSLPVTLVNSTTIRATIPKAADLGYTDGWNQVVWVEVGNPGSDPVGSDDYVSFVYTGPPVVPVFEPGPANALTWGGYVYPYHEQPPIFFNKTDLNGNQKNGAPLEASICGANSEGNGQPSPLGGVHSVIWDGVSVPFRQTFTTGDSNPANGDQNITNWACIKIPVPPSATAGVKDVVVRSFSANGLDGNNLAYTLQFIYE